MTTQTIENKTAVNTIDADLYKIHKRNDHYVRFMLSNDKFARDFFTEFLDDEIRNLFDWDSLQSTKADFVTSELREKIVDGLWQVKSRDHKTHAYLYLEHYSNSQSDLLLEMRYRSIMIKRCYKQHNKDEAYPSVIEFVLNQSGKDYSQERDYFELHSMPELERSLMSSPLQLVDLNALSDKTITQLNAALGGFLLLLKHTDDNLQKIIKDNINLFKDLFNSPEGAHYGNATICYIISSSHDEQEIKEIATLLEQQVNKHTGKKLMNTAQTLLQRVEQENLEKGMEKGIHDVAKKMLQSGMAEKEVEKYTGLTLVDLEEIKKED